MAHKKAGGSTRNGRDSESKRLGVKVYAGESIDAGGIIIRQRGSRFLADPMGSTYLSKDYTVHAKHAGRVKFVNRENRKYVAVVSD